MRKMTVLGASALLVAGLMASPAAAFAAPVLTDTEQYLDGVQVCEGYDSGKIDTTGDPMSVTVEAPEGELISGYCVKAGSAKQGEGEGGAYFVELDEPAASVTITYPWATVAPSATTRSCTPTASSSRRRPRRPPSGEEPSVAPSEPSLEPTDESAAPAEGVEPRRLRPLLPRSLPCSPPPVPAPPSASRSSRWPWWAVV